jgi:hypothetical protein
MIAFMLLAPIIFLSMLMSAFAGVMGMLAAAVAFATGPLIGAAIMCSTAFLAIWMFLLS